MSTMPTPPLSTEESSTWLSRSTTRSEADWRVHRKKCLAVRRYSDQYTRLNSFNPNEQPVIDEQEHCPLCQNDFTNIPKRFAPLATDVLTDGLSADTDNYASALRTLITYARERVQQAGHLDDNVGISVKSRRYWKRQRRTASNTDAFDRIVMDGLEVSFAFDILYFYPDADSWEDAKQRFMSGKRGLQCEEHVAKTLDWLSEYTQPRTQDKIADALAASEQSNTAETTISTNTGTETENDTTEETDSTTNSRGQHSLSDF